MNPIKQARKDLGWTQKQLAQLAGINQTRLSRLENMEELRYFDDVVKIEKALGLPTESLLS